MQSPEASLASSSVSKSDFSCEYEYTRNYNVRSSCVGESFYKEHKGKRLCVLHHPDKEKSTTFDEALKRKLNAKDFNFRGVWFPDQSSFGDFVFNEDVDFSEATFDGDMSFSGATFNGNAYFSHSTFNGAVSFDHIKFIGCQDRILLANFSGAIFNKNACFSDTEFNARVQASFSGATFNAEPLFDRTQFNNRVDFSQANFNTQVTFYDVTFGSMIGFLRTRFRGAVTFRGERKPLVFGEYASLRFDLLEIDNPDRVSFINVSLHPHWFVNIDVRKFEFINVEWVKQGISHEIRRIEGREIPHPHPMLSITYRQLAMNAEENHRYEEASRFRYLSMDVLRHAKWCGLAVWRLDWWYWAMSGYGEKVFRASMWLIGIWAICALLYWNAPFIERTPKPLKAGEEPPAPYIEQVIPMDGINASLQSLGVLTLQKPEARPVNRSTKALMNLEAILGPLQAALLALAIRRKFMR